MCVCQQTTNRCRRLSRTGPFGHVGGWEHGILSFVAGLLNPFAHSLCCGLARRMKQYSYYSAVVAISLPSTEYLGIGYLSRVFNVCARLSDCANVGLAKCLGCAPWSHGANRIWLLCGFIRPRYALFRVCQYLDSGQQHHELRLKDGVVQVRLKQAEVV